MKKAAKFFTIALAVALVAVFVFAFAGCGGTDYVFEAESSVIAGEGNVSGTGVGLATVETGPGYIDGKAVEELTDVGNFNTAGQTLTFTITSDKACSAKITLQAASAAMGMNANGDGLALAEIDFATQTAYKLTNNGTEITLSGKLPGLDPLDMSDQAAWRNMGKVSGNVDLVAGENKIVLEIVGAIEGTFSSGLNVDKITINAPATLTWTPTTN